MPGQPQPEALEQFNNIQESANRDYLTGLYNRRYWFNEGQKWFEEHQRHQAQLSLCVLDVDHFKQVNDHWGMPSAISCSVIWPGCSPSSSRMP